MSKFELTFYANVNHKSIMSLIVIHSVQWLKCMGREGVSPHLGF